MRIKNEHPDDDQCIVNGRVKGRLKVTRSFGAGFLKQVSYSVRCILLSLIWIISYCGICCGKATSCIYVVMSAHISVSLPIGCSPFQFSLLGLTMLLAKMVGQGCTC